MSITKTTLLILALATATIPAEEVKSSMHTVLVRMMCNVKDCKGEMKPTGSVLTSYPAQYPHVCETCKAQRTFGISYPTIRYEPLPLVVVTTNILVETKVQPKK